MLGLPFNNLPAKQQEIPFGQGGSMTFNPQQFIGPAPKQQNKTMPSAIIENEIAMGQRQINEQFDQAKFQLDQQVYKNPEDYINAINELKGKAAQAGLQLRQKAEAKMYSLNQVIQLVKEGSMPQEAGQRAAWRIAGLSDEQVDAMLPETKPRNLIQEHAAIAGELNRLENTVGLLAEKNGKLYHSDNKGNPITDEPATEQEINEYFSAKNLQSYYLDKEQQLFEQMSPGLQASVAGQRAAMEQKGSKVPWWKYVIQPSVPGALYNTYKFLTDKKTQVQSSGTLDENTARQILIEANGDKERARQIAKERGYKF